MERPRFLCMSRLEASGRPTEVIHGAACSRRVAHSNERAPYEVSGIRVTTWAARADWPHKCDVRGCSLNRARTLGSFRRVCVAAAVYLESSRALRVQRVHLCDDVIDRITKLVAERRMQEGTRTVTQKGHHGAIEYRAIEHLGESALRGCPRPASPQRR
jgi:hypothetical protein